MSTPAKKEAIFAGLSRSQEAGLGGIHREPGWRGRGKRLYSSIYIVSPVCMVSIFLREIHLVISGG
jgi:hypothetical protein